MLLAFVNVLPAIFALWLLVFNATVIIATQLAYNCNPMDGVKSRARLRFVLAAVIANNIIGIGYILYATRIPLITIGMGVVAVVAVPLAAAVGIRKLITGETFLQSAINSGAKATSLSAVAAVALLLWKDLAGHTGFPVFLLLGLMSASVLGWCLWACNMVWGDWTRHSSDA